MKLRLIILFFFLALASRESIAAADSILVTVDTLCDGWRVCVKDQSVSKGISFIYNLHDSSGTIYPPPIGRLPYMSDNTELRYNNNYPEGDSMHLIPSMDSVCFDVKVLDVSNIGYAALVFVDVKGQKRLIELRSKKFDMFVDPLMTNRHYYFGTMSLGKKKDELFSIGVPLYADKGFVVTSVSFRHSRNCFVFTTSAAVLPTTLLPGDNHWFRVLFSPKDTVTIDDTIDIVTDCFTYSIYIAGTGGIGKMDVVDPAPVTLFIGQTSCEMSINVRNIGKSDYLLHDAFLIGDTSVFLFNQPIVTTEYILLPYKVLGLGTVTFNLCYRPKYPGPDSAMVVFRTDIPLPYSDGSKDTAFIKVNALLPKIYWDTSVLVLLPNNTNFRQTNLNTFTAFVQTIDSIYISGKDSNEFTIMNSESTLSTHQMAAIESDWFTLSFTPDMTKPLPERHATRHAQLVARLKDSSVVVDLIGDVSSLEIKQSLIFTNFSFNPNPVYGQDATLSFTLAEPKELAVSIYDILGREVMSIPLQYYSGGSYHNTLETSKLSEGMYVLRVSDGSSTKSISFRVVK